MSTECGVLHPELGVSCRAPADGPNHPYHYGGSPLVPIEWVNDTYRAPISPAHLTRQVRQDKLLTVSRQLRAADRRRVALARSSDPETSHEAARGVGDTTEAQEEILALFFRYGPMDDEQVAQRAYASESRQTLSGLRTRRRELVDAGLLVFTGRYAMNSLGNRVRIWGLS